jgi:glycerol-3-phosphate acyltransferase PlsX
VVDLGLIDRSARPAIATVLPIAAGRELVLLDAGANVDCKSEHLARFADLGAAFAEVRGIASPRIGLLANGEEVGKGNALTRGAFELLQGSKLNFVGNIEPHRALAGGCDVLVCDGYAGNAVLKSAEGAVSVVGDVLRTELKRSWRTRLGAWIAAPAFRALKRRVSWDAHGGALLLGVDGVVVVGHGRANPEAVGAAIRLAHYCSRHSLVDGVRRHLATGS